MTHNAGPIPQDLSQLLEDAVVDVMRFKDVSGMLLCELEKLFGVDEVAAGLLEARKYKLPTNNIIPPPTPPTAAAAAASPPLPGDVERLVRRHGAVLVLLSAHVAQLFKTGFYDGASSLQAMVAKRPTITPPPPYSAVKPNVLDFDKAKSGVTVTRMCAKTRDKNLLNGVVNTNAYSLVIQLRMKRAASLSSQHSSSLLPTKTIAMFIEKLKPSFPSLPDSFPSAALVTAVAATPENSSRFDVVQPHTLDGATKLMAELGLEDLLPTRNKTPYDKIFPGQLQHPILTQTCLLDNVTLKQLQGFVAAASGKEQPYLEAISKDLFDYIYMQTHCSTNVGINTIVNTDSSSSGIVSSSSSARYKEIFSDFVSYSVLRGGTIIEQSCIDAETQRRNALALVDCVMRKCFTMNASWITEFIIGMIMKESGDGGYMVLDSVEVGQVRFLSLRSFAFWFFSRFSSPLRFFAA